MSKSRAGIVQADPGTFVFLPLSHLTGPARKREINFAEWGVCECDGYFWVGGCNSVKEKDVLKVSALDALDKRNEEYPDWGDEEVYVVFGFNKWPRTFEWRLLNFKELSTSCDEVQRQLFS